MTHFKTAREYPRNFGEGKHHLTLETHLNYFEGQALAEIGQFKQAKLIWRQTGATKPGCNMFAYFKGLAPRSLSKEQAALFVFEALARVANELLNGKASIDCFATSLPNFLLFEDDLRQRQRVEVLFLRGLAGLCLGRVQDGVNDLEGALRLDKNHLRAHSELSYLRSNAEPPATRE